MRPPVPIASPAPSHLVVARGELRDASEPDAPGVPFEERTAVVARAGTAPLLHLGIASGDRLIDLELLGSVQVDGVLTVTTTLRLGHARIAGDGAIGAETTVVAPGARTPFALVLHDDDGCAATATGVLENRPPEGPPPPGPGR